MSNYSTYQATMGFLLLVSVLLLMGGIHGVAAQDGGDSETNVLPEKDCRKYDISRSSPLENLPPSEKPESLHEFVCRWSIKRDYPPSGNVLKHYTKILNSITLKNGKIYIIEMEAPETRKRRTEDDFYIVFEGESNFEYEDIPLAQYEGYNEVELRYSKNINNGKKNYYYIWSEFSRKKVRGEDNKIKRDTTRDYWEGHVYAFKPSSFSLYEIDQYLPPSSGCPLDESANRGPIPIRITTFVNGQKVSVSQIDVRFSRPGVVEITPRTDTLVARHEEWLGTRILHSSESFNPLPAAEPLESKCEE